MTDAGSVFKRHYASSYGRFNTADPMAGSASTGDPGSWNRYGYVGGDPINHSDTHGLSIDDSDFCAAEYESCADGFLGGSQIGSTNGSCSYLAGMGFGPIAGPGCYVTASLAFLFQPAKTTSTPPPPIYCEPDVIAAMAVAWQESGNGIKKTEAGFRVDGPPIPGTYTVVPNAFTNQIMQQTMNIIEGLTTSVFHVHPNGSDPPPSTNDKNLANQYNFDMFTISRTGLYEYDPTTKSTTLVRSNLDWLKPCPK